MATQEATPLSDSWINLGALFPSRSRIWDSILRSTSTTGLNLESPQAVIATLLYPASSPAVSAPVSTSPAAAKVATTRSTPQIFKMPPPRRLRVAVSGLGRMGARHALHFLERTPRADLVAAFTPDAKELAWAKQRLEPSGVTLYTDYDEMLKHEGLEAVVVSTVTTVHADQAIKAIRADKHVLCEKPLSTSVRVVSAFHSYSSGKHGDKYTGTFMFIDVCTNSFLTNRAKA